MTKDIQNSIIKNWKKVLEDYEMVKKGQSEYFKTCKELYDFYRTSAKQVSKYRRKLVRYGGDEKSLLPDKRGPKFGTNRTPKDIERYIIKAYRRLGKNRYELVMMFTPVYGIKTPKPSTMSLIVRRYQKGLRKKDKERVKRYEKDRKSVV